METATQPQVRKKQRFLELDIARAALILMLPFVHVYEEMVDFGYASERVIAGGKFLLFLCALGPSAFMLFLGMNVVFSSRSSPKQLAARGLKTIAYFFLLNLFRALLPALVAYGFGFADELSEGVIWSLASDILFFAGCAFLFFALMARLKARPWHLLLVSLLLLTVNTLLLPPRFASRYLTAFLGNFFYIDETSCFPLLSWLIFPALGYCAGLAIKELDTKPKKDRFYRRLLLACAACLAALCACMASYGLDPLLIAASPANEYRTDLFNVALDVCMVGVWTAIAYFLCSLIRSQRLLAAANKVSDAILVFYCAQWVLVGWAAYLMMIAGFGGEVKMSDGAFVLLSFAVFAVSLAVSLVVKRAFRRRKEAKASARA